MTRQRPGAALRIVAVAIVAVAVVAIGLVATGVVPRLGGPATPTTAGPAPRFVDETATSGLDHTYTGDIRFFTGGGLAVFDCDDDGRPELYAAGGERPAVLFHNDTTGPGAPLRFSRLPGEYLDVADVIGAYPLDVDGDGAVDLAILRYGGAALLRGLGGCRFEAAPAAWAFDGGAGWATAFAATWEAGSTWPTVAVGNYRRVDPDGRPAEGCEAQALLRPAPDGAGFGPPIPLEPGYCTLSMLFSDWDRLGRRDLRVSNDRQYYRDGQEQLWRIAPGEPPRRYTAEDGWVSMQLFGMGIASQDLTGDGLPEVYLTSQGDNKLQTLLSGPDRPTYRDIALRRGVTAAQPAIGGDALPSTAWHPEFADVNVDGFLDLFVSKGNVFAQEEYAARDPSDLFLGQPDGTFVWAAADAGIVSYERARGAALVDLDLDGLLDLVVVNLEDPMRIWRNVGAGTEGAPAPPGHWVAVRPLDVGPNRDAIGGWLEIRIGELVRHRELTVGGGHAGGQLGWIHTGLGPADRADVRVHWPDGETGPWLTLDADAFHVLERATGLARPWDAVQD